MIHRVLILLRARLGAGPRGGLPVAALFGHALVGTLLCALVGDQLDPWPYALFVLGLTATVLAIPLLGELGEILRTDEAGEWVAALPVLPADRRVARTLHLLLLLGSLALAILIPAAVLAPAAAGLGARLALLPAGLGIAVLLAAVLLLIQSLLAGRAEGLLVLFQTALVCASVAAIVLGLGSIPALAALGSPEAVPPRWFVLFPPAWFAAPVTGGASLGALAPSVGIVLASLAVLLVIPAPSERPRGRRDPPLALLLRPVRAVATRLWVRPDERGMFDLVYDALPREREFVLRTYPLLGIPIAFLAISASGGGRGSGAGQADLLALLLFSAGVYLPVLLTQVPGSASHGACWLHESAPIPPGAVAAATIKAIAIRFLVPLYVVLAGIAVALGHTGLALRLAVPGALTSLLVLRAVYPVCVRDRPLSVAPDRLHANLDWFGTLAVIGVGLALVAVLANRFLTTPAAAAAFLVVLLGLELVGARATRNRAAEAGATSQEG